MSFVAVDVAYETAKLLKEPIEALTRRNRALGDQALRAASSIVLNLEEGNCRTGGDRLHSFRIAEGSAKELRAALRLGTIWAHIAEPTRALQVLDRLCGLIYGLTHPRKRP
jgi:four helix bundle protein